MLQCYPYFHFIAFHVCHVSVKVWIHLAIQILGLHRITCKLNTENLNLLDNVETMVDGINFLEKLKINNFYHKVLVVIFNIMFLKYYLFM